MVKRWGIALLAALMLLLPSAAMGREVDAQAMENWLYQFCEALGALDMLGDPTATADPARPGEMLLEYTFGTVKAKTANLPRTEDILEIHVRTPQVTDCRGMRVGMRLGDVTGNRYIGKSNTQLYVLSTLDAGLGFAWAYLGDQGVYGVEHVAYGGEGANMKEYTLTYVIDENGVVSSIRIRCTEATQAQAQQAMDTAEEIALRQRGEVYAVKNHERMLEAQEMQLMGVRVLGTQVAELVAVLGEPVEIQTLTSGRLLLYEGAAVELEFNVQTGEEVVCGVSVSGTQVVGPRRLSVGMSVQEAASLFRCDEDVYAVGGTLYMEGEAAGESPCGELIRGEISSEATLCYLAPYGTDVAALEIGLRDGVVSHWYMGERRTDGYDGI